MLSEKDLYLEAAKIAHQMLETDPENPMELATRLVIAGYRLSLKHQNDDQGITGDLLKAAAMELTEEEDKMTLDELLADQKEKAAHSFTFPQGNC